MSNDLRIDLFDVTSYLNDKGVDFVSEGNEVSEGWIGITCFWCDDRGHHLGVHLINNIISCWRCGEKGNVARLVREIDKCYFSEALEIMEKYQDFSRLALINDVPEISHKSKIQIPTIFRKLVWPDVPDILQNFLFNRGFDPETICRGKELYYGGHLGKFKFRIILPITLKGKLISWIGRDVTGKANIKYLNLEEEKSVLPIKNTLYGYDEALPGKNTIVVEGPLDQWKLGPGAVATYGTQWTLKQVSLLRELNPNKVIILYDTEDAAQKSAKMLAKQIWFCKCEVFQLEEVKDPGDLSLSQSVEVMRELINL